MLEQSICFYSKGFNRVHVISLKIKRNIERWKNTKLVNTYFFSNGTVAWDFIVPSKNCKFLSKHLGKNSSN